MQDALFYIFAFLTLVFGFLVIANPFSRNPVTSAMFLVLTIVSLAGLFILLHAFFLAAVQVLVYAGAVMVLFLFVIMLLNLREADLRVIQGPRMHVGGVILGALFLAGLVWTCRRSGLFDAPLKGPVGETGTVAALFRDYVLPFEIVSFLLLAAMVGAVLLSKRRLS